MMTQARFMNYTLGLSHLDELHRSIFESLNRVIDILKTPNDIDINSSIKSLHNEVKDHAVYEEDLMRSANYPYAKWHCEQHVILLGNILKMESIYKSSRIDRWLIDKFENEFINHLDHEDRKMVDWLSTKYSVKELNSHSFDTLTAVH